MTVHVVRSGENLWAIARTYGVSIQSIVDVNGLPSTSLIIPGLALYIPDQQPIIRYYKIKAGDTLWRISSQFMTNISSIVSANPGMDPNRLYIGQNINIPSPVKPQFSTLGFIVPGSSQTFLAELEKMAPHLTFVAVVAFSFTEEGYAYVIGNDGPIVRKSRDLNIIPLLLIQNTTAAGFSKELAGNVLSSPTYRRNLVASLVNLATQRGYSGISVDLEFIPPPQREDFNAFLRELKGAMGNLILHVNVHAKTEDIPTNPIIGAYDYKTIGEIADIVAVMTIDYGYPGGPPDPVSPLWWIALVVRYSLTLIPREKLQIGLPLYGHDKVVSTNQYRALSVLDAQNLGISVGAVIQYDTAARSPWFRYWKGAEEHIVWFEDIRSYIEKYRLIDLYQLNGTTYWQLSLKAPQNWAYLDKADVIKL
ncbi:MULTISPECIES: LysM peptidoglycan-binding domain-containing protein [unclassified Bacillus (in: firmicutes)]|uniref:LysM peptidoglycan-binding domain-containing protein n=1 Tax=unclassified Bacillus (in: firmicutes) TaxID=185979 RepID=UPI001BE52D7F|nr:MULTISPECIES: LysM peptidoglycan-binding domain-containing protein [unclassified Bacillus (in: firmicutes)]MBT2638209.1 LysM peptidoglycan-binding domain-containing protein [Bacillus sp. ISL-39]MBT2662617.1 LysM peptidoglycan-binding domain-containing protein [Bacillus sp. ISL-45]